MVNFILVLSVLVLFHELGHFLAARYFGVTVESFSIGFGPKLLGINRNGTEFKVCLLPLGGYVKMAGQALTGEPTGEPGGLDSKPRWQRLIIIAAGPVFNFILAIALLAGVYMYRYERATFLQEEARIGYVVPASPAAEAGVQTGDVVRSLDGMSTSTWMDLLMTSGLVGGQNVEMALDRDGASISSIIHIPETERSTGQSDAGWSAPHRVALPDVVPGAPAQEAGIQAGDVLVSIDGEEIIAVDQVLHVVSSSGGRPLALEVERQGERLAMEVSARQKDGSWRVGIAMRAEFERIEMSLSFQGALDQSLKENAGFAGMIFHALGKLIVGDIGVDSLAGPVGIYEHTQTAASYGVGPLLQFMALISVNLGVLNLAPIPVLDGGQILLLLVESMLRRDVSIAVKNRIAQVGLLFIVILFGIVMYNDVMRQFFSP